MKRFFSRHGSALLISLAIGLAIGLPPVLGAHAMPGFSGIYKQTVDDQDYYLARGRDVIDGHPFLSNPYLAEHKDGYPLQVWLPDYLLAAPLAAFGIPVQVGYAAYVFLFAAALFFLAYLVAYELTGSRAWGIGASLLLTVGYGSTTFVRLPSPGFNFIFVLLAWYFSLRFIRIHDRSSFWGTLLSFGLLFHVYPYFWTFVAAGFGIFIAVDFLFGRDRLYRSFIGILAGGFIIGLPYFWATYEAAKLPSYTETLERIGLIFSHFPSGLSIVGIAALALLALGFAWRKGLVAAEARLLFLASGVFGAIVAVNQHVITGENLEFSSHYLLPSVYWCGFAVLYSVHAFVRRLPQRRALTGVLAVLVIAVSIFGEYRLVRAAYAYTSADVHAQSYVPVFRWLNEHTNKDDVVFTNDDLGYYVPIYTADDVYSSGLGILFFLPDQEAEQRYIINHYWDTFTPNYIEVHQRELFGARYIDEHAHVASENTVRKFLHLPLLPNPAVPQDAIERVVNEAKAIQEASFATALKTFRVDYFVWNSTIDPVWNLGQYPFLSKQYSYADISVYRVK